MDRFVTAEPYEFKYNPSTAALVLIDFQNDFISEDGFGSSLGNDVSKLQKTVGPAKKILDFFRKMKLNIIHTKECHMKDLSDLHKNKLNRGNPSLKIGDYGKLGRILIDGEHGNDFIEEMKPIEGEYVIKKKGKGAFYDTSLDEILKKLNVESLIFMGVTTEVCVLSTMKEANDRGYNCLLLKDCTGSYFDEFYNSAQGGIVGWVSDSLSMLESFNE